MFYAGTTSDFFYRFLLPALFPAPNALFLRSKRSFYSAVFSKKTLIDEEGEALLKSTFFNIVEQVIEQEAEQDLLNQLNKQLNTENEYLRKQNELLMQELSIEREHSRQQAESLSELSEKLAELTKNGQILLLKQEQENTFLLSDEQSESKNKKSLWQKLFKGKKK